MHTYVYTNILYTTKYYEKIMYTIYIYIYNVELLALGHLF